MTKLEFMKKLESLLSDIPLEEREEALQYYNGYFEDAGEEHEQEIIEELVSPEKVAAIIKAALNSNGVDNEDDGYYTEKGYQDSNDRERKHQLMRSDKKNSENGNNPNDANYNDGNRNSSGQQQNYSNDSAAQSAKQYNRNTNIALIILAVIACILGCPLILSVFGVVIGIIAAIIGVIIGLGVAGVAMMICGVALVIAGLIKIAVPFAGMLLCGSGLLVFGLGMLFTLACVMLCKNVLPAFIKGVINICRRPFQNRSVTA